MFAAMTVQLAQQEIMERLEKLYPEAEVQAMSAMLLEALTGWSGAQLVLHRQEPIDSVKRTLLEGWMQELAGHRPIQYVIGYCWFYKHRFNVNEAVLIPRAETEELVHWVLESIQSASDTVLVTDIGTGSGCIAVSIAAAQPRAIVKAVDKSREALKVAEENAARVGKKLEFIEMDFLDRQQEDKLSEADIFISNPPYIPLQQREEIASHVRDFEPSMALFVADDDPLIFYRRLAELGKSKLRSNGWIYVEIHEYYGKEVVALFHQLGYINVVLKKDMQGKDRMVRAQKNT